jgi:hypothetical protein
VIVTARGNWATRGHLALLLTALAWALLLIAAGSAGARPFRRRNRRRASSLTSLASP